MMQKLVPIAGFALALALVVPGWTAHHKTEEAASILERVESLTYDIREQAARIRTYNRAPELHSWQLHASELGRIESETDEIADLLDDFKGIKQDASQRQNYAYNKVIGLMSDISDQTTAAIRIVNTDREKLTVAHPDYTSKIDAIYDHADEAIEAIGIAEDLGELMETWKSESDE